MPRNKSSSSSSSSSLVPPPQVAGAWPIVGHLPKLIGSTPLFKVLGDMSDKYGPIFMVHFGMYPTIVVSNWEMAKECLTTNDKIFATRPPSAAGKYLGYDFAMIAFSFYGPYWREIRKFTTLQLLSHRRLELLKHVPYTEIDNCIKRLYRLWMKNRNQQILIKNGNVIDGSVKVDMSQVFRDLTLNVVLKLVVGKNIALIKNKDDGDSDNSDIAHKLHKTIVEFFEMAGVSVASDALPFLRWLDLDGQKKRMKKIAKEMDLITERWLEEHRHKMGLRTLSNTASETTGNDHVNDFMDVLLSVFDEDKDLLFDYSRDTIIKATSLSLILAASDTTSVSLTWALALLLTNPGVLKKAQDELDAKVSKDRNVEESDLENLVYLQAIVKETLRMYPAGPLSVPHEATQDCKVGGYQVRAGTRLLVNIWKLHRDPRVWSNPSEFRPERFLPQLNSGDGVCGESSHLDFRGQNFEFLPFGSGRRMCPGINFALQTMHMSLARLLHAFDFENESSGGEEIDMKEGSGLTMPKVTPLEVHLRPRLPLTLYEK